MEFDDSVTGNDKLSEREKVLFGGGRVLCIKKYRSAGLILNSIQYTITENDVILYYRSKLIFRSAL